MSRLRLHCVLLATLTLLFGLHIFRVFLPTLLWYLGQFLTAEGLALYGLGTFVLALLAPLVRRWLGPGGALSLTVGGLALVRLGIQVVRNPLADLMLATAGIALLALFLPVWCQSRRNCPSRSEVPVLAVAFPLAFLIDTGSRTLLLSYDLAWRSSLGVSLIVFGLVAITLALLGYELRKCPFREESDQNAAEPSLSRVLPLLGLGPWLYVALTVTHNPVALAVATGWDYEVAHLAGNVFAALGAVAGLMVAGWSSLQRWQLAFFGSVLLVGALTLFGEGVRPAWVWVGLASVNAWAALGEVLTSTARTGPLQPGLWRSGSVIFLALTIMLATVIAVFGYNLLWMTSVAGVILGVTALWATRVEAGRDGGALRERVALIGIGATGVLLAVALWAALRRPPQFVEGPPAREPLRVMTYNIHHGLDADFGMDLESIASVIAAEDPDVVVLNEVNRARLTNGFVDTLPLISRRLRMRYVYGANLEDGQYGNAILSRYPILAWDNMHYAHNTTEIRGLLRAVVQVGREPITFYATHLDNLEGPNHARTEQVFEALAAWGGTPRVVLLGDLNADPDAPELQAIYQSGFVDALGATGQGDVFTSWEPVPSRRIDYIFLTPDVPLRRAWVVPSRASDHLPVLAEVVP